MTLSLVTTAAGRAAIVNAQSSGTNALTIAKVGITASVFTPLASMTALPGEIKKLNATAGGAVAAATIHMSATDASSDVYDLHGFGLYLTDGTLFALYSQVDTIHSKAAGAQMLLAGDIVFSDLGTVAITVGDANFLNPPATTEVQGVVELATSAETIAKTDTSRAVTVKGLWDAFTSWIATAMTGVWTASNDGAGSGLDAGLLAGQLPTYYTDIKSRLGYTPANLNGDTFTGAIKRDASFFMEMQSANPILNFDSNDYLHFDRSANQLNFIINATSRAYLTSSGIFYSSGGYSAGGNTVWHVGNDGAGSGLDADLFDGYDSSAFMLKSGGMFSGVAYFQDANFYATLSGGNPAFNFGTGSMFYERTSKSFLLSSDGTTRLSVNSSGIQTPGSVTAGGAIIRDASFYLNFSGSNPILNFDSNDFIAFDRTINQYDFYVGAVSRAYLNSAGLTVIGTIGTSSAIYAQGGVVWNSANDGAGSGLDAGLLAGQLPSYYQRAVTAVASMEIGADLTTDSAVFLDLHASNGSGAVDYNTRLIREAGVNGNLSLVQTGTGLLELGGGSNLTRNGNTVWHAGNDGAGSGLDAGLLGGLLPAAFALAALTNAALPVTTNANGTCIKIGKLIIQVGMKATVGPDTTATVTYPVALTNAVPFFYLAGTRISTFDSGADSFGQIIGTPGLETMTVDNQRVNNSATIDVPWIIMAWAA